MKERTGRGGPFRGSGRLVRRTAGTGLLLAGALFLLPLLTVRGPSDPQEGEELPSGTLPIERAAESAGGRDRGRLVKLLQPDGTYVRVDRGDAPPVEAQAVFLAEAQEASQQAGPAPAAPGGTLGLSRGAGNPEG